MEIGPFLTFFDAGSAAITRRAAAILDNAAASFAYLASCVPPGETNHGVYLIAGHSDRAGSASANRRLSCARARAVRAYLVTKGISPDQLITVGYGEDRPIVKTPDGVAEIQNRYVETSLMSREQVAKSSIGPIRC
jgi:outer membrane protein OmpA-like peptidoglycan-associated protein